MLEMFYTTYILMNTSSGKPNYEVSGTEDILNKWSTSSELGALKF